MFKIFFSELKGQAFTASNIMNEFSIVYCLWPKQIMKLGSDGYFHKSGTKSGVLVKRVHLGEVWYHQVEDYLEWKKHLDLRFENETFQS